MKLTKYLGSVAFAAFSSTIALGHWETNSQFEETSHGARQRMVTPREIIESYYRALNLKNAPEALTLKGLSDSQLTTPLLQAPFFDLNQPLTSQNVARAIAAFLHVGDTPEALRICQKVEAVFKECDYDKRAAKREGIQVIFKEALSLIEHEKQIKPKLQTAFQNELNDLETRMNQGLEKALKYSHERQKAELLLALDIELDNFLQTRKEDNKKLPLISTEELYNLNERTKGQIEERFVKYEKNPPTPKRTHAVQQIDITKHLDEEMDVFKIRLKIQKDMKHPRRPMRTISFYTPPSTEKVEHNQGKILNERRWVVKAKAWEQGKAK